MRVVIAGAGVAGLSVANALVRRGVQPIVIAPDHGYTPCGAGVVSAQFEDPLLARLAQRSQALIRELVPVQGRGMVQIALSEHQARRLARVEGGRPGLPDRLTAALSPAFRSRITAAARFDEDFWVCSEALVQAMSRGARRVKARVLRIEQGELETDAGRFAGDWLVLALGPWSGWLVRGLGLERRRAQLARAKGAFPSMVYVRDMGLCLRPDGADVLLGDGDAAWRGEPNERAARPTSDFLGKVERQMGDVLGHESPCEPAGAGLIVRAATARPIVRAAGRVVVVTGFGARGLSLAPACGEQVAEGICGGDAAAAETP